ncbi:MAG: hypothetical protein QXN68_02735 [Thermoplasmata archaeon]
MNPLLDMFAPYMLFISFLVTISINIWLISKNVHWIAIIFGNVLIMVVMQFFGLQNYDFLTVALNTLIGMIIDLFDTIIKSIGDFIGDLIGGLFDFKWPWE